MSRPLSPAVKLLTGIVASGLVANFAYDRASQQIVTRLARRSAMVMLANGVTDGSVSLRSTTGWTSRTVYLSGTADAATRARILAAVRRKPGIAGAEWRKR